MFIQILLIFVGLTLVITPLLTKFWINYQNKVQAFDVPVARSSHSNPTPRGGGIAIVAPVIVAMAFILNMTQSIQVAFLSTMPFILLAMLGFYDDKFEISAKLKLFIMIMAIAPFVFLLPPLVKITFFTSVYTFKTYILLLPFFICALWVINLTNFMDGINGIATLELIFLCAATLLLNNALHLSQFQMVVIAVMGAACLAFLPFNFPHAKVFLGDVGSLFMGGFAVWLAMIFLFQNENGLWAFLTLFALFWVDASYTLVRRLLRKANVFTAHRDHAYQHLANSLLKSHQTTSLLILAINALWLFPLAYLQMTKNMPILAVVAIVPVFVYCHIAKAGQAFD